MKIANTSEGFETLWRRLETTRQMLAGQCRRYCVRNVMRAWFPSGCRPMRDGQEMPFDDFVWRLCRIASPSGELLGWTELPPPSLHPRLHRELLRALTMVVLGITARRVNLHALDHAYSAVFPASTPIDIAKKGHPGWRQ